jgi:hypothetical protein
MDPRPWNFPSDEMEPSYCMVLADSLGFAARDMAAR